MDFRKIFRKTAALLMTVTILGSAFYGCSNKAPADQTASQTKEVSTGSGVYISLDSDASAQLPKRFRKSSDAIDTSLSVKLSGLYNLNISGSGQFGSGGLPLLKNAIGDDKTIYIIDLRQESHGYANGLAISWSNAQNKANKGLTCAQVTAREKQLLKALLSQDSVQAGIEQIKVTEVATEEDTVKAAGLEYLRLPVTNNECPADDVVDSFVNFVKAQPQDSWLHFHCMEGIGRTTLFMTMYDCMKNAKKVSLNDIMTRQTLLGGKNLLNDKTDDRAKFLEAFYKYCSENDGDFSTVWSDWVKAQ